MITLDSRNNALTLNTSHFDPLKTISCFDIRYKEVLDRFLAGLGGMTNDNIKRKKNFGLLYVYQPIPI